MLKIKNISKSFSNKIVLKNVNMDFLDNGFYIIRGKSGIGKTTLLNLILGLETPEEGQIIYNDRIINSLNSKKRKQFRLDKIGSIFQEHNLIEHFTVEENLSIIKTDIDGEIDPILKSLDIYVHKNKLVNELSGGERQRVAIARSIYKNSEIIIADEPTSNLDLETAKGVLDILKQLSKNRLVIVVSHENIDFSEYADCIYQIESNSVINCTRINENLPKAVVSNNQKKTRIVNGHIFKTAKLLFKKTLLKNKSIFLKHLIVNIILLWFLVLFLCFALNNTDRIYFNNLENFGITEVSTDSMSENSIKSYSVNASVYNDDVFFQTDIQYILFENSFVEYNIIIGDLPINKNEVIISDYLAESLLKNNEYFSVNSISELINKYFNIYYNEMISYKIVGIYETPYRNFVNLSSYFENSIFELFKDKNSSLITVENGYDEFYDKISTIETELAMGSDYLYGSILKVDNDSNIIYLSQNPQYTDSDVYVTVKYLSRFYNKTINEIISNVEFYYNSIQKSMKLLIKDTEYKLDIIGVYDDSNDESFVTSVFAANSIEQYDSNIKYHSHINNNNAIRKTDSLDRTDAMDNFYETLSVIKIISIIFSVVFVIIFIIYNFNFYQFLFDISFKDFALLNKIGFSDSSLLLLISEYGLFQYMVILVILIMPFFVSSRLSTISLSENMSIELYFHNSIFYFLVFGSISILYLIFQIFNHKFIKSLK